MKQAIEEKLKQALEPRLLEVINESDQHRGERSESHFKLIVVSEKFENLSLVKRHQLVYTSINKELSSGIHALSQHTFTPEEWIERGGTLPKSPPCQHKKT